VVLSAEPSREDVVYRLRAGGRVVLESPALAPFSRAHLELTWRHGDRERTWSRQLFDLRNARTEVPGHDRPRAGDRYALVVAAGPLVAEVLPTRTRMLESDLDTPVADPIVRDLVLMGARYLVDSDLHTRKLAEETGVAAAWRTPRIVVAASEVLPEEHGGPSAEPLLSLDALANRVEAEGERARAFHVARGWGNDVIESHAVFAVAQKPVLSATTILSRYGAPQDPESPERRIELITEEASRVLSEEPIGTSVWLLARPPRALKGEGDREDETAPPTLVFERMREGLVLHGLEEDASVTSGRVSERYRWAAEGGRIAFAGDAQGLAVVADAMLSRRLGRPNYRLEFELVRALASDLLPVAPASFHTTSPTGRRSSRSPCPSSSKTGCRRASGSPSRRGGTGSARAATTSATSTGSSRTCCAGRARGSGSRRASRRPGCGTCRGAKRRAR